MFFLNNYVANNYRSTKSSKIDKANDSFMSRDECHRH